MNQKKAPKPGTQPNKSSDTSSADLQKHVSSSELNETRDALSREVQAHLDNRRHRRIAPPVQPKANAERETEHGHSEHAVDLFIAGKGRAGYSTHVVFNESEFNGLQVEVFHNRTGLGVRIQAETEAELRRINRQKALLIERLNAKGLSVTQLHIELKAKS